MTNELTAKSYLDNLNSSNEFSLSVDPQNIYRLTDEHKRFIELYVQYKDVSMISKLMNLTSEQAAAYLTSFATSQEVRRINRAMYHYQFANKLLSIDDIAGYLSSLITDHCVVDADRLKTMDKVKVAQLLLHIHQLKADIATNAIMSTVDVEEDLRTLSISAIKNLLTTTRSTSQENLKTIDESETLNSLSPEEKAYLTTLPTDQLLNEINKFALKGDCHEN